MLLIFEKIEALANDGASHYHVVVQILAVLDAIQSIIAYPS